MAYRATGFSLIEVLVSVFVLALGIIGAAGMQLTALRTNQQSAYQTAAVQLASEFADRMRSNDTQMKRDDGDNPYLGIDYEAASDDAPAMPSTNCYTSSCSGAELAEFDIYEWKQRLKAALPNGRVVVCRDTEPWDDSKHGFTWDCSAGSAGNATVVVKVGWQGKNADGSLIRDAGNRFPPSVVLTVEPYIR